MKTKLCRIRKPWRRILIASLINVLFIADRIGDGAPRAHWVGDRQRPNRLAFYLFTADILASLIIVREPMRWAVAWGGAFAIFVMLRSFVLVVRPHRVM